jgi:hypothetical protein
MGLDHNFVSLDNEEAFVKFGSVELRNQLIVALNETGISNAFKGTPELYTLLLNTVAVHGTTGITKDIVMAADRRSAVIEDKLTSKLSISNNTESDHDFEFSVEINTPIRPAFSSRVTKRSELSSQLAALVGQYPKMVIKARKEFFDKSNEINEITIASDGDVSHVLWSRDRSPSQTVQLLPIQIQQVIKESLEKVVKPDLNLTRNTWIDNPKYFIDQILISIQEGRNHHLVGNGIRRSIAEFGKYDCTLYLPASYSQTQLVGNFLIALDLDKDSFKENAPQLNPTRKIKEFCSSQGIKGTELESWLTKIAFHSLGVRERALYIEQIDSLPWLRSFDLPTVISDRLQDALIAEIDLVKTISESIKQNALDIGLLFKTAMEAGISGNDNLEEFIRITRIENDGKTEAIEQVYKLFSELGSRIKQRKVYSQKELENLGLTRNDVIEME